MNARACSSVAIERPFIRTIGALSLRDQGMRERSFVRAKISHMLVASFKS
jgi:hypothetical protein